jgi:hypothetical protein
VLVISRKSKKEQSRPWAFSLQGCTVMLGAQHHRQLALHSADGQTLYLRALSAEGREEWVHAINASVTEIDSLAQRSQSALLGPDDASTDGVAAANQAVVARMARLAALPQRPTCLDAASASTVGLRQRWHGKAPDHAQRS